MELQEPINLDKLLEKPLMFSLDRSNMDKNDENLLNDDIDADEVPEKKSTPWLYSFDELKQTMVKLPNFNIYKRIIHDGNGDLLGRRQCRIQWSYSTFFEKDVNSYDSSYLSGTSVKTSLSDELLLGIWCALETMRKGEEAEFIIDNKLMYGDYGHMVGTTKVKPKADILLVAKLIHFDEVGQENACEQLTAEELRQFRVVKPKAMEMQTKVNDFCKRGMNSRAISICLEIIHRLQFCEIQNNDESDEKSRFLADVYAKLIDCYVKNGDYKKACSRIDELRKAQFTNVDQNVNILVNEAIVHCKIDDNYKYPIQLLRRAQQIEPCNERVNIILNDIQCAHEKYENEKKTFNQRAFQSKSRSQTKIVTKTVTDVEHLFSNLDIGSNTPLIGYTDQELKKIELITKNNSNYDLQVTRGIDGQPKYSINKLK